MTQPTTERDRIKERVAKLLNLTLDKGASENEAMMAAEKAAELMAFYDIEASELSVRSARATKQTVSARKYGKMIIAAPVAHHVAQLCDCMYWGSTEETGKHYTFLGLPADAEIAAYLFDLISNGIATEVGIYKASSDYLTATGTHGRTLVSSIHRGYGRSHLCPARRSAGTETFGHSGGNRALACCYQSGADRGGLQGHRDQACLVGDQALNRR